MCPSLSIRMLSGLMSLHQNNPREETHIVSRHTSDHRQIVGLHSPMNETARPPDRENALCDMEPRYFLREGIVLGEHCHQVASGKELHDEVRVRRAMEWVV